MKASNIKQEQPLDQLYRSRYHSGTNLTLVRCKSGNLHFPSGAYRLLPNHFLEPPGRFVPHYKFIPDNAAVNLEILLNGSLPVVLTQTPLQGLN